MIKHSVVLAFKDVVRATLSQLEAKLADPNVSELDKNNLRNFRDYQQQNLKDAQYELTLTCDKLNQLLGESEPATTPLAAQIDSATAPFR